MPLSDEFLRGNVGPESLILTQFREQQRQRGVTEIRSNRELTTLIGRQLHAEGRFDEVAKLNPDFRNHFLDIEHEGKGSAAEEMFKGFESGVRGLGGTILGAGALASEFVDDLLGSETFLEEHFRDPLLAAAQEQFTKASEAGGTIKRLEDIRGFSDTVGFVSAGFGQALPSIGEAVITGGVGGAVAKQIIKGLTKRALKKKLLAEGGKTLTKKQIREAISAETLHRARMIGVGVSTFSNSFALSSGEIYTELASDPDIGPETAEEVALFFGGINALPDSVFPALIANKMFKNSKRITATQKRAATGYIQRSMRKMDERIGTRALKGLFLGSAGEGTTEGFQEYMNIIAKKYQKGEPAVLSDNEISQIKNAAAVGAIGGGGVTTIASLPTPQATAQPRPDDDVIARVTEKKLRGDDTTTYSREELEALHFLGQERGTAAARKEFDKINATGTNTKVAPDEEIDSDDPTNPQVIERAFFKQSLGETLTDLDVAALTINEEQNIVDLSTLGVEKEILPSESGLFASVHGDVGNITPEAEQLLNLLDEGTALPTFITKNLRRLAKENNVEITEITTPDAIIESLRFKKQQPPSTPQKSKSEFLEEDFIQPVINPSAVPQGSPVQFNVPDSVVTAKPRFVAKSVVFDSALDKALWVSNAPKAGSDAREFITSVTGWSESEIKAARKELNQHIKESVEDGGGNLKESGEWRVASLFATNGNLVTSVGEEFDLEEPPAPPAPQQAPEVAEAIAQPAAEPIAEQVIQEPVAEPVIAPASDELIEQPTRAPEEYKPGDKLDFAGQEVVLLRINQDGTLNIRLPSGQDGDVDAGQVTLISRRNDAAPTTPEVTSSEQGVSPDNPIALQVDSNFKVFEGIPEGVNAENVVVLNAVVPKATKGKVRQPKLRGISSKRQNTRNGVIIHDATSGVISIMPVWKPTTGNVQVKSKVGKKPFSAIQADKNLNVLGWVHFPQAVITKTITFPNRQSFDAATSGHVTTKEQAKDIGAFNARDFAKFAENRSGIDIGQFDKTLVAKAISGEPLTEAEVAKNPTQALALRDERNAFLAIGRPSAAIQASAFESGVIPDSEISDDAAISSDTGNIVFETETEIFDQEKIIDRLTELHKMTPEQIQTVVDLIKNDPSELAAQQVLAENEGDVFNKFFDFIRNSPEGVLFHINDVANLLEQLTRISNGRTPRGHETTDEIGDATVDQEAVGSRRGSKSPPTAFGAPQPAQSDPIFGTTSIIQSSSGQTIGKASQGIKSRSQAAQEAIVNFNDEAGRVVKARTFNVADTVEADHELTENIVSLLTLTDDELNTFKSTNADLYLSIIELRKTVPLLPMGDEGLMLSRFAPEIIRNIMDDIVMLESQLERSVQQDDDIAGVLYVDELNQQEDDLQELVSEGAEIFGIEYASSEIRQQAQELADTLESSAAISSKLQYVGQGSEATVWTNADRSAIYKVINATDQMLGIPERKTDPETDVLTPWDLALLEGHDNTVLGRNGMLQRINITNDIDGFAFTEIMGLTPTGQLILKQANLGSINPQRTEFLEFLDVKQTLLSPKAPPPQSRTNPDSLSTPFMSRDDQGNWHIHLDANQRNSAKVGNEIFIFDSVSRELLPEEIQADPELSKATRVWEFENGAFPAPLRNDTNIDAKPSISATNTNKADYTSGTKKIGQYQLSNDRGIEAHLQSFTDPLLSKSEVMMDELVQAFPESSASTLAAARRVFEILEDAVAENGNQETLHNMQLVISDERPDGFANLAANHAGGYNPVNNTLWINPSAHSNPNSWLMTLIHESGHFFTSFVLGSEIAMQEWQQLSSEQRTKAWADYLNVNGGVVKPSELNDNDLINSPDAMQEWAAFLYTRLITGGDSKISSTTSQMKSEGISNALLKPLVDFYKRMRDMFMSMIGDPSLSTKDIDDTFRLAMGIGLPEFSAADAIKAFETQEAVVQKIARGDADARIAFLRRNAEQLGLSMIEFVKNTKAFAHANAHYRIDNPVAATVLPVALGLPQPAKNTPNPKASEALHSSMDRPKHTDRDRVQAVSPNIAGMANAPMVLQNAWALNNELSVLENIHKSLATDFPVVADLSFAEFHAKFISTPSTPESNNRLIDSKGVAFDKKTLTELRNDNPDSARFVAFQFAREMYENWQLNVRKQQSDRERLIDIDNKISTLTEELNESDVLLQDAQRKTAQARESLRKDLNELQTNLNGKGAANKKLGKLGAIIESLEGTVTQPIAKKYVTAINKLIRASTGESLKLFDLIEAVVFSGVDFKTLSPAQISKAFEESDSVILQRIAKQDKPTVGALIAIVKADTQLMNDIQTRKLPDIRAKVAMMEERIARSDGTATEAASSARQGIKGVALESRLFGRIQEVASEQRTKLTRSRRVKKNLEGQIGARDKLIFTFNRMMNDSLSELGGTIRGDLIHGSKMLDPATTTSTWSDIRANAKDFSLKRGEVIADAEYAAIMTRQREWLSNEENKADPWLYNIIDTQHKKMKEMAAERVWTDVRTFVDKFYPAPLAQEMKRLGTAIGDNMNRMANKYQTVVEVLRNDAKRLGDLSAVARDKFIKSTGMNTSTFDVKQAFTDVIDTPSKYHLEQPGATFETLFEFLLKSDAAPFISSKENQNLLKEYLEAEQNFSTWMKNQTQKLGLGVTDTRILNFDASTADAKLTPIERLHLNIGAGNFMLTPNKKRIVSMVDALRPKWSVDSTYDNLQSMYDQSEEEGDAALRDLFRDDQGIIQRWFLDALVKKDKAPAFMKRLGPDGVRQFAEHDEILDAWQRANGDIADFLRNLWNTTGQEGETYSQYVNAQVLELRETFYKAIDRDSKEVEESESNDFVPDSVRHTAIDARKSDLYPSQWIAYRQSDERSNVNMAGSIAFHAAFGKDGNLWKDNYNAQKTEFIKLTGKLQEVIDATDVWARTNPGSTPKQMKKQQERFASQTTGIENGKRAVQSLRDSEFKLRALEKSHKSFLATFGSELGPTKDMGIFQEGLSMLIKGILNGVRSALVQLNQIAQPFLFYGLSATSFQQAFDQIRFTGKDLFGSFMQAFGAVIDSENEELNLQRELFGSESDIGTPFWASLMSDFGVGSELRVGVGDTALTKGRKKTQKLLRVMNGFMSRGYNRADAENVLYQSFKPWAPFAMLQGALNRGAMVATRTSFNKLAMKAINFMETNVDALNDPDFKFTASDLGMTGTEFGRLNAMLNQDVGISLEISTRDAIREGRAKPFTEDQYKLISVIGMGILSSEGNFFTTRAAFLREGTAKILFPLLGWSIQQPNNFLQVFKNPRTGEVNMRSASAGLLSLGMGVLPWVLGLAFFVDWWDEEVMGKKNNKRPLFNKESWKGGIAERVIDSGMMGWWAEGGNLAMNIGQGDLSSASLDKRVLLLSTGRKLLSTFGAVTQQGLTNTTWASGGRNLWQAVGGNGMLQNIDMLSNLADLDTPETRVIARINLNNHVRSAGRGTGMEMRSFSGQYGTPTPMTPWVTQMMLSAYANDRKAFIDSYNKALSSAKAMGKEDPVKAVQLSYQGRHPLRTIFRRKPTPAEWRKALGIMSAGGRRDTLDGLRLYDRFGAIVGVNPMQLGDAKKSKKSSKARSAARASDPFGRSRRRRSTDTLADPFG